MALSKRNALLLVMAIFLGIIAGLVISANFDVIFKGFASSKNAIITKPNTKVSENPNQSSTAMTEAQGDEIDALLQLEKAYIRVAEEVKPWVVTITSAKIYRYRYYNPFEDFFDFFGYERPRERDQSKEREFRQEGLGSGVIVSKEGYILTNNHVVQEADEIRVITMDKKEYDAKLIGKDEKTDVAVVKIASENLPCARLGDSDKIMVGQIVLAVGNPFSQQLQQTVTDGIISAKGRSNIGLSAYEDFIQTTAAINPGNSGGALVDLKGNLIGINTAILSRSGGFNGIGFAIPINMAKRVMEMLMTKGYVLRGYLGVVPQPIDEEMAQALGLESTKGAFIGSVEQGTPADKAGLKERDVVVEMNDKQVVDDTEFRLRVAEFNPGDKVKLKVFREGKFMNIWVTLTERPDDKPPTQIAEKETEKIGLSVADLTTERARRYGFEDEEGVLVVDVKQGSSAWRKGVREGDLITEINKNTVRNVREYERIMDKVNPGDVVILRLKKRIGDNINTYYVTIRIPR